MAKDKAGKRARDFLKVCLDEDGNERQLKLDDLKFGIKGEQWDADTQILRKGRLMLTINKLPQFVKQVCNEQRQNSPQVKIVPAGITSNPGIAKLLSGIIKNIEAQSRASEAYDTAFFYAVCCGEGYFRVLTNYSSDDTFDQDIRIEKINNPFSVYLGEHQRVDGSDAKKALITELITKEAYKERYGKEYAGKELDTGSGDSNDWTEEEKVRVAEYWEITGEEKEISLLTDGRTVYMEDLSEEEMFGMQQNGIAVKKSRSVMVPKVTQYIVDGTDTPVETNDWAGKYIPIVKVTGDEVWIEGKRYTSGLIRPAKDPQKMYNYWRTTSTELVALAPKAPYMLTPKQIENHQGMWDKANIDARPYLLYNPDGSAGAPQRVQYANSPVGAVSEALGANDDMKQVTGINDASKGLKSNETSGRAIKARKAQGDIANYNYIDNMGASIAFLGRILVDLIPKVYDSERAVRIQTPEGQTMMVPINQEQFNPVADKTVVLNDITIGEYDVECTVGPNYATQRQEAVDNMTQLIQYAPEVGPLIADLIAEMMDSPISEQISARLKKMLPPQLQEGGAPPIPPELQQQMQEHVQIIEQQGQELQQLKQDHSLKQAELMQKQEISEAERNLKIAQMNQQFELEVEQMNRKYALAEQELQKKYQLKQYEADLDAHCKMEATNAKMMSDESMMREKENGMQEKQETEKEVAPQINVIDSSVAAPIAALAKSVDAMTAATMKEEKPSKKVISMVGPSGKKYTGTVTEQ